MTVKVSELIRFVQTHYPEPMPFGGVLERCDLSEIARRQAGGLSGGQRRRLALALAMCGNPELMILDESTAGLDLEARSLLWNELGRFRAGGGTVLLTTHDLIEAERLADHVAVAHRGQVILTGTPDEIRSRIGVVRVTVDVDAGDVAGTLALTHRYGVGVDRSAVGDSVARLVVQAPAGLADELVATIIATTATAHRLRVRDVTLEEALTVLTTCPDHQARGR